MASPEQTPSPGSHCGPYALVREIGTGGMGVVYEAVQTSLKRRVAVKLLADWALSNARHRERFVQEAEIAARMRHPNIVEVHDVGMWGERPYFVMELLEGRSLADELEAVGAMDASQIQALMLPVMSAVAAAHDRGVVHRDLKPENIFIAELDSGMVPKVLDFGISQILTRPGSVESYAYGTPHYMAPELVSGAGCDERSDQYSLGVVLHELVKGRLPDADGTVEEVLRRVRQDAYPAEDLRGVPDALRDVILRATQRDPDDRFNDLRDMSRALGEVSSIPASSGPGARAVDTAKRASRMPTQAAPAKRGPRIAVAVAVALVFAATAVGVIATRTASVVPETGRTPHASIAPSAVREVPASARQPEEEPVGLADETTNPIEPAAVRPTLEPQPMSVSMRRRVAPMRRAGPARGMQPAADPWGGRALPPEPIGTRMTGLDPWAN